MKLLMHHYPCIIAITILLMSVLFWSAGCSKSSSPNDDKPTGPTVVDQVKATVTSTGADLTLKNGMTLSIPAGAVTSSTSVTLSQLSGDSSFSATFQTVLRLETSGALIAGHLRVPLDSNQQADLVAAAYRPVGEIGARLLSGSPDATSDTFLVDLTSFQDSSQALGSLENVGSGTYVVEKGEGYQTTLSRMELPIPYYKQDGENCWAAATLMFLRSYVTVLGNDEVYEILNLFGIDKNAGISWRNTGQMAAKTEDLTGFKTEQNTWISYSNFVNYVLKSLDEGKPVLTCVVSHQIVICGYEIEGSGDNKTVYLIFHDPVSTIERKMYTKWTAAQVRNQWWNQGLFGFTVWNFVTVTTKTPMPQAPRLQTVQLLDPLTLSGVSPVDIALWQEGIAFGAGSKPVNAIKWDHRSTTGLGLQVGTEVPQNVTTLSHKQVPVWNTDLNNAAQLRVKTTLHRVHNGVYREPALLTDQQNLTVPAKYGQNYGVLFNLEPTFDDLEEGDTLFALVTAIYDQSNLMLDDFDVQFKFRPLRIKSLEPASGKVGDNVTIEGIGFGRQLGQVTFNGVEAEVTVWSNDKIYTKVPSGATSGDVKVKVGECSSNGMAFSTGSMLDMLHKTKYPSVNVMGVFNYKTWTGYALFPPSYNWETQLVWNDTAFSQSYVKPTEEMRETVNINGSVNPAGTVVKRLWSSVKQETLRDDGTVSQQIVSEIRITDLPLDITYDDPGEFIAIFALEKEQIAPKLQKIRFVRTDYDEQGEVIATDSLINVNWLNPNHEGLVQMWFHEKGID
jgi:hypothetical protein